MSPKALFLCYALALSFLAIEAKLVGDDCEVCVQFLTKFKKRLTDNEVGSTQGDIELELFKACKDAIGKEERLCYYIGATDIAATKLVNSVTKPMSFSKPVEKICEDLKKKDAQICELRHEKQIDLNSIDLKKLRVKELKKILNKWGEVCRGCVEKTEFIDKINLVKVNHIEL